MGSVEVDEAKPVSSKGKGYGSKMLSVAKQPKKDRHKKRPLQLRLHELLRQQLEALVERNASNLTGEITIAIRERLERANLWPPPPRDDQASTEGGS
jgi:hypothetical protein